MSVRCECSIKDNRLGSGNTHTHTHKGRERVREDKIGDALGLKVVFKDEKLRRPNPTYNFARVQNCMNWGDRKTCQNSYDSFPSDF